MDAFITFILTSSVVLLMHYNNDVVLSAMEFVSDYFFGWSVQRLTIEKLLNIATKCLYSVQIGLVVIELIAFVGFVTAINADNYTFPIIVMWIGLVEKIGSFFPEKIHKQIFLFVATSLKIALATYFNNPLNVFANTCKLITLLLLEQILTKIKYIFLKQGFIALVCNTEINEDSLQSSVLEIINDIYYKLSELNTTGIEIRKTIDVLYDQVLNIIDEINVNTKNFATKVNKLTNHLYKVKIFGMFFIIYFLNHVHFSNKLVVYSLFAKILEYTFGSITPVNSMMDTTFEILRSSCNKIKRACLSIKITASIFSIAQKQFSK